MTRMRTLAARKATVLYYLLFLGLLLLRPNGSFVAAQEKASKASLIDLQRTDELREVFNRDIGHARLVSLLSPT